MHHTDAVARVGMLVGPGGIVAGVDHPLHILRADVGAVLHLREARAHLYDIYRISPAGGEAPYHARVLPRHGEARALGGMERDIRDLLRLQRPEENLHAAAAKRGGDILRAARGRAHQSEIRRETVFEDVVDVTGNAGIIGVIVGRFQHHLAVLQDLEQLVHLDGMQLTDLIQEQNPAVRLAYRAGLGLGNTLYTQRPRPLIDGIVHAADERVCDGAFIEANTGRVHFNEGRVGQKGCALAFLGGFQHQARGAGLAHARRSINEHMLRILSAQNGLERFDAVLLAHDVGKLCRANALGQRFAEFQGAHLLQPLILAAALTAV